MVKKAIDSRIPALIRNGAQASLTRENRIGEVLTICQEKKRSFFVVVGDRQKDVIVNLYHILLNVDLKLNKSVLWAYKNKLLGFTSHRKKREQKIKKEIKRGIRDADTDDPFELFVSTQNIRYVYYKETEKILGNTYGMCILQDFEAITPNLLARTIETVEGGGIVLLLLKGMSSLKQLYTMSMDVHSRYRTEAHDDVVARFNERFILSLGRCDSCLVVDDELNVLPISGGRSVQQLPPPNPEALGKTPAQIELAGIKESLADTQPVGPLISLAKTVDQAKALLTFVDAIAEKTLQSTVTLTAARGRGKSAALGVAIAAAVAHGYSNIFITSPSPENLKTLFEFVFKGFDALEYADHADYTIIQSTNPDFNKAIVRVNIHRNHRQTIQYIQPRDAYTLGQAELLVIDEAAAIPLPLVRKLMGPYLVFMASTINGYEGTGRSLSLKLIQQLREQSRGSSKSSNGDQVGDRSTGKESKLEPTVSMGGRSLREIKLSEPIRYAEGDAVESWLNKLLCLDATLPTKSNIHGCPHPSECELLYVNRDTLFSFHHVSEKFLQQMMALYVASHYKNSPNDLQLMSDAPAHQLFVLVPPVSENQNRLPEPLCVIQLALEGQISRESVMNSLARGQRAGGDLIPWLISQQFQDEEFAALSGARIVRIATNPDYINMGYGSRALQLLTDFYTNKFTSLSEDEPSSLPLPGQDSMTRVTDTELESTTLLKDDVKVRDISAMPPLFSRLNERRPNKLDYLGVSYGLTQPLHKFWKRAKFVPVYLRQTANELTGEHTCVMLRTLDSDSANPAWLGAYSRDFQRRFLSLLSYQFRSFGAVQALSIEESAKAGMKLEKSRGPQPLDKKELDELFSPFDLKRLDSYANNMLDYHVILDLLPRIAELFFLERMVSSTGEGLQLSGVQKALLCAIGLQRKTLDDVEKELGLGVSQLLSMFIKVVRKVSVHFRGVVEGELGRGIPGRVGQVENGVEGGHDFKPLTQGLDEELEEEADGVKREEKERMRAMIDALPLDRYEIATSDKATWEDAEKQILSAASKAAPGKGTTVSVPKKVAAEEEVVKEKGKKSKDGSEKKRKVSAIEDARRELEKAENSKGGSKKKKHR
ncbi:RNA cytidine acetyltransferase [Sphaceloma murrayae]|uniref:RNA cytidine acetyltransferase n=1 Tax=Sphaceloma murrayae TaxID=2082308 RepID=A0A2K1QYZ2_9PEZI|nr:RNA cytidine acetyltransferase [Sphaceloma murrayae]